MIYRCVKILAFTFAFCSIARANESIRNLEDSLKSLSIPFSIGEAKFNETSYPIMVLQFASDKSLDEFFQKTQEHIELTRNSQESGSILELKLLNDKLHGRYLASVMKIDQNTILMVSPADALMVAVAAASKAKKEPYDTVTTVLNLAFKFGPTQVSTFVGMSNQSVSQLQNLLNSKLSNEGLKLSQAPKLSEAQIESNQSQTFWLGHNRMVNASIEKTSQGTRITIHETTDTSSR